jgi:tRNA (cmo5U34)-methyltransferase
MSQYHFTPDSYLEMIRADVERFDELQDAVADATRDAPARRILELGTGTGETARRVLELHPEAEFVGVDESDSMLNEARQLLPASADLRPSRLQNSLPDGPFDLVFSCLTVHHLDGSEKAELFGRVANALRPGGRFVLADVVVPDHSEDAVTPLTEGFDLPDSVGDQLAWLEKAGFRPRLTWSWKDLAVISADL